MRHYGPPRGAGWHREDGAWQLTRAAWARLMAASQPRRDRSAYLAIARHAIETAARCRIAAGTVLP